MRLRLAIPILGVLSAVLTLIGGCTRPKIQEIYPVEGVLTVNGEPAENASVAFHPRNNTPTARCPVGVTDKEGKFSLTTLTPFDGAPVGEYAVTIVWLNHPADFDECDCPDPLLHDRLKGRYANPHQSTVRVTVRPQANKFEFDAWRERTIEDLRQVENDNKMAQ